MNMLKAYRYRIYPNEEQIILIAKHFGCVRHVYNWGIDCKQKHYQEAGKSLPKRQLQDMLVAIKKTDKPWLNEVNSQSLLAALENLDTAFRKFFRKEAEFPTRKKKYSSWQSYQCPQHVKIDFSQQLLNLPKIKHITIKCHREFDGKIKTVTIKRSPTGKYFVSILVEEQASTPVAVTIEAEKTLGLDMGITHFLIDSEGTKIENPRVLNQSLERLRIEQRILSRQHKGSHNRAKQKTIVAKLHERVSNRRNDFIHQTSAKLAVKNQATSFAIEDLNIAGMVKNHRLARAISDCGWGKFIAMLAYKCEWNGKNLLKINRFAASSKTCSHCYIKQEKLPLAIRQWECSCGAHHDRDINAARMIKHFALAQPPGH